MTRAKLTRQVCTSPRAVAQRLEGDLEFGPLHPLSCVLLRTFHSVLQFQSAELVGDLTVVLRADRVGAKHHPG